jgi:multiple sugar transport system substrate-binding protein
MSLRLVGRKFIGFEKALEQQARSFRDAGGDEVEMEFLEVEDLYERMISNDGCAKGESDIMMVCTDWYPTLCAANALVPLNDFINQNPPPDWPDGWTDSMLQLQTSGGRILGLPYHDGPEMFIYRRDLFEDESEKNSFRERSGRALELPKNWTEFLEVSQHFTRPDDGLHGTLLATFPDAHNIIYDFFIQLWTRGGEVLDADDGRVAFNSKAGVEALQFEKDLIHTHKVVPPNCAEIDSVESGNVFSAGKVAMMVNWTGFASFADAHESSQVRGKVGCGQIPAGDGPNGSSCSLNIYWCLSVTAGSQNQQAAYDFLRHCSHPEMDIITSEEGGIGVRRSTWIEFANRGVAGYSIMEELHANARHQPQVPSFGAMTEILNEHLNRALNEDGDPAKELNAAAEKCQKLL